MQDKFDSFGSIARPSVSAIQSPYLNFDPSILNPSGSQFIVPEGQGEHRSKMELSFFTMGSAVGLGGLFGGLSGIKLGLQETANLTGKIRYSQMINFVTKRGSISAQSFGALALMYSLYDTLLYQVRDVDDELNKVCAATLTGVTYNAPYGMKRIAKGGVLGLALSATYLAFTHREFFLSKMAQNHHN